MLLCFVIPFNVRHCKRPVGPFVVNNKNHTDVAYNTLTLLVGHLEEHAACKKLSDEVFVGLYVWLE